MNNKMVSPLLKSDLEGAAYLCLAAAAMADLDQISGSISRRLHNERKCRFEKAQRLMEDGVVYLSELGISHADCSWAASKAKIVKDKEGWLCRFQTAENELQKVINV